MIQRQSIESRLGYLVCSVLMLLFVLFTPAPEALAEAGSIQTAHLQSQLVSQRDAVVPGQPLQVGLLLEHEEHWHTYWKNSGDSGLPTRIEFVLPSGFKAQPIEWPVPERINVQELINYGYSNRALLPITINVPAHIETPSITIQAKAKWLICNEICIPGEAEYRLVLPVNTGKAAKANEIKQWSNDFKWAEHRQPQAFPEKVDVYYHIQDKQLELNLNSKSMPENIDTWGFFPATPGIISNTALPAWQRTSTGWQMQIALGDFFTEAPKNFEFVMVQPASPVSAAKQTLVGAKLLSYTFLARLDSKMPAKPVGAGQTSTMAVSSFPQAGATTQPTAVLSHSSIEQSMSKSNDPKSHKTSSNIVSSSLAGAMLLAFLGGMVLNLMPCVFPVLSLKALALLKHSNDHATARIHGIFYTLGVVVSFVCVAIVLGLLRQGGEQLGWGFQLQEPRFVAALALLMCGIALNFMGLLEIGNSFSGVGQNLTEGHGKKSAFFTGVLACIVASPCTAPFMGTALGFALSQSISISLAVFIALGLGMAFPMLLISFVPVFGRCLPRPGAWMESFKQLMAFPILLTAIWLTWVYGEQTSVLDMAHLLASSVFLALGCWVFQRWGQHHAPTPRHYLSRFVGIAIIVLSFVVPLGKKPAQMQQAAASNKNEAESAIHPEVWSQTALERHQKEGRPVFVNMTAAWCITCLANQRAALSSPEFAALLKKKNIIYMKGDWTRADPAITAYLESFGRNGVPLYVVYPLKGKPKVLPQLLTPGIVREALEAL
ncbi:MAG: protein-disulfide reductase DsbD domain-containing protein [Pseudomonadota bacterium]